MSNLDTVTFEKSIFFDFYNIKNLITVNNLPVWHVYIKITGRAQAKCMCDTLLSKWTLN